MSDNNSGGLSFFHDRTLGSVSEADFKRLCSHIKRRYGLDLTGRKSMIESRLYYYVIDRGFTSFEEYFRAVYDDSEGVETANIINRLTTNYTYFMREQEHFAHFSEAVLPPALKLPQGAELCIWSAGCSFGNEAYSFAMCMEEFFAGRRGDIDRRILATDISQNALLAARRGRFAKAAIERLPEEWQTKYFSEKNGIYTVSEEIRSQVVFRYHNLMEPIKFKKKFDLIICRNVMIYFDKKTKSELIKRFYEATAEGGYLYIGHAETVPEDCPYERVRTAVYRKGGAAG